MFSRSALVVDYRQHAADQVIHQRNQAVVAGQRPPLHRFRHDLVVAKEEAELADRRVLALQGLATQVGGGHRRGVVAAVVSRRTGQRKVRVHQPAVQQPRPFRGMRRLALQEAYAQVGHRGVVVEPGAGTGSALGDV